MTRWAIVLVVVAVVVPGVVWASEFLAVDRCLDAGGVYDFGTGQCDRTVLHRPYVSFSARHRPLLVASFAVGLLGVLLYSRGRMGVAVA